MSKRKKISLYAQAAFYAMAGVMHFVNTEFYLKIMPDYLPWHRELVYISGVAEIVLGIGLLIPAHRKLAAYGIILLLIAVFPANIYQLTSGGAGMNVPLWGLWLRLPLQFALIYWAYTFTKEPSTKS